MIVFQYKCRSCLSVFEHQISSSLKSELDCVSCGNKDVIRLTDSQFSPKKKFCPK